jgi:hypothetical protein
MGQCPGRPVGITRPFAFRTFVASRDRVPNLTLVSNCCVVTTPPGVTVQPSLSELIDALARAMGVPPPPPGALEGLIGFDSPAWFHEMLAALTAAEPTDWRDVPASDVVSSWVLGFVPDVLPGIIHTCDRPHEALAVPALAVRAVLSCTASGVEQRYRVESDPPKFEHRNGYWVVNGVLERYRAGTPIPYGEERTGPWIPDGANDPSPELLEQWARDTTMYLCSDDEDIVALMDPRLVPKLLELAGDPTVAKAGYIINVMERYLPYQTLGDVPVHRIGRDVALRSPGPAVRALGERLARLDQYLSDVGPVDRATADAFFHDLERLGAGAEQGDWWVSGSLYLHRRTGAVARAPRGGLDDAALARLSAEAGTDRRGVLRRQSEEWIAEARQRFNKLAKKRLPR